MSEDLHKSEEKNDSRVIFLRGWAFPNSPLFSRENIEAALDYRPLDGDIVLCSYPKTGSTWMQYIIWQILYKAESFPSFDDVTHCLIPFMEMTGVKVLNTLQEPRFYKNHFPYHLMNKNDKAKYIYVHRNPSDTLASFYHFDREISGISSKFEDYFARFIAGDVSYGDYFDHVLSFYSHKTDSNLLFVSYEDLQRDNRQQILRIAKFLGNGYYEQLQQNESLLEKIMEVTSFSYMKKNLSLTLPVGNSVKNIDFFRKGIVGDGKNLLSPDQEERLKEKMLLKMKGTEFIEKWS